jgi:hypothetical protein
MDTLITAFGLGDRGFLPSIRVPLPGFRSSVPSLRLQRPVGEQVTQAELQTLFARELSDLKAARKARKMR